MAPPIASSDSKKRRHAGDDNSATFVDLCDLSEHGDRKPRLNSDGEISEGEEEMMTDEPYNEAQEQYPQRPAFDSALRDLDVNIAGLTRQLQDALKKHSSASEHLQSMKLKADEAVMPPTPERLLVAMMGATGAGKSSLLNAITDTPHLAKAVSAGESCTSVPTYYMHTLPWQSKKFAAEIRYYNTEKCRKLLEELLAHYNLFTFEDDEEWSSGQRSEYSQQADTAMQTFRTLFCEKAGFNCQRSTEEQLARSYQHSDGGELLDMMALWCEGFFAQHEKKEGAAYTRCEVATASELRSCIDPVTAPVYSEYHASLWPLVELVEMGVQASRVLHYVTIVDLPGITDTNRLRVEATHDSIRKCQALWYVATVDRICTDPDLERTVSDYGQRFGNNLAIVVTKIDEGVGHELALDLQSKGQNIGDVEEWNNAIVDLKDRLKTVKRKLKFKKYASEKSSLRDQEDSLSQEVYEEESKNFECLVDARNAYIGARLQKEKKKHLPPGVQLPVHFVSNKQYAVHKQVSESEGPRLAIESTGIPALRSYALCLATPEIWKAHEEHLMFKVKFLFHGVNGWAQDWGDNALEGLGLMERLSYVIHVWQEGMNNAIGQMDTTFDTGIIHSMRAAHAASMAGVMRYYATLVGENWHKKSFFAFFKKAGKHRTQKMGYERWNERFIERQTKDVVNPAWDTKLPPPGHYLEAAIAKLTDEIKDLPEQLSRLPESVTLPMSILEGILNAQIVGINAAHQKQKAAYQHNLGNIKLDATLDEPTSHFAKAMAPCYAKGNSERGLGCCQRTQECLLDHLTNNDPLGKATDLLATALLENAHSHARILDKEVRDILADVDTQFAMILQRKNETSREKLARRQIRAFLDLAMPGIDRIAWDLAKIRQKHSEL